MPVSYNGFPLIPAPLMSVRKTYVRAEDNTELYPEYLFDLRGTIVNIGNNLDTIDASGYVFGDMQGVLGAQSGLRQVFGYDGGLLEVSGPLGSGYAFGAYCFVENLSFADNNTWTTICPYTVTLRSVGISTDGDTTNSLQAYNENWNITEIEDGSFNLSHQLSAQGALSYSPSGANNPLLLAQGWCNQRKYGIATNGQISTNYPTNIEKISFTNLLSNINNPSGSNFWNYALVEGIGSTKYSWQITENFIYYPSGNAKELFSITQSMDNDNPYKINVSIAGTITGYGDRAADLTLRNANASGWYVNVTQPNIYPRVLNYVPYGFNVFPVPTSRQVSYELSAGLLRYAYVYPASSGTFIAGAIEESIQINDVNSTDVFAQIPIPGRTNGPIVQYMQTKTLPERSITINATMGRYDTSGLNQASLLGMYLMKPNTDLIIQILAPNSGVYYYIKQNSEEWNPVRRQYGRTTSWVIQPEGVYTSGMPNGFHNPSFS